MSERAATADNCHQPAKVDSDVAVETALKKYEVLKLASEEIDKSFVWPEGKRPDIVHDQFDFQIPVIDLSQVLKLESLRKEVGQTEGQSKTKSDIEEEIEACEAAKADVERAIRAACEEYGFFQIVNHSFPMEVVEQLTEFCRCIFDLPLEEKMKLNEEIVPHKPSKAGYTAMTRRSAFTKGNASCIWNEGFHLETPERLYPGRLEELTGMLWPGESENREQRHYFKSTVDEYGKRSSSLAFCLLDLMAASFGLPEKSANSLLGDREHDQVPGRIRINHYPVCPQPELTWGLHGHTDPSILTLLHQDTVGGLQIRFSDGTWHGVKPISGAFVVNVGDFLQAWTNGRFLSAEHRVVANEKSRRFSLAYFAFNKGDKVVSPRPEFVDDEHPLRYRPFTESEYFRALMTLGLGKEKGQLIDEAFGIESQSNLL